MVTKWTAEEVKAELQKYIDPEKAEFLPRFFKTKPGEYGEGDCFIGVVVPDQRKVARMFYQKIKNGELASLLNEPIHEYRLTALFMLVKKFEKAKSLEERRVLVDVYLDNIAGVNNWDLVDSSAPHILGQYLYEKQDERSMLDELADSGNMWKERIAVMATFTFIKKGEYGYTLNLAERFLSHKHDLIHKAVGWMLREIGNRDLGTELGFLKEHYRKMPRTMLRYAIEKFEPLLREDFLKGRVE